MITTLLANRIGLARLTLLLGFGMLVILNGVDCITTAMALGGGGGEVNPLVARAINAYGVWPALIATKLPWLLILGLGIRVAVAWRFTIGTILWGATAVYGAFMLRSVLGLLG